VTISFSLVVDAIGTGSDFLYDNDDDDNDDAADDATDDDTDDVDTDDC